jgi:hypothetical protein
VRCQLLPCSAAGLRLSSQPRNVRLPGWDAYVFHRSRETYGCRGGTRTSSIAAFETYGCRGGTRTSFIAAVETDGSVGETATSSIAAVETDSLRGITDARC